MAADLRENVRLLSVDDLAYLEAERLAGEAPSGASQRELTALRARYFAENRSSSISDGERAKRQSSDAGSGGEDYEDWEFLLDQGDLNTYLEGIEGRWIAFAYSKGSRPGTYRSIRVVRVKVGRVHGELPPPRGGAKTYYTQFMSGIRVLPRSCDAPSQPSDGEGQEIDALIQRASDAAVAARTEDEQGDPQDADSGDAGSTVPAGGNLCEQAPLNEFEQEIIPLTVRCFEASVSEDLGCVTLVYHPHIVPFLSARMRLVQSTLDIACYVIDDYFCTAFERVMRRGVRLRVIVDKHKVAGNGGCVRAREALRAMLEWGASLRARSPAGGMTAAQHEKSWLFDGSLAVTGSFNLTKNSVTICEEAIMATSEIKCVSGMQQHFDDLWDRSMQVDVWQLGEWDEAAKRKRSNSASSARASSAA